MRKCMFVCRSSEALTQHLSISNTTNTQSIQSNQCAKTITDLTLLVNLSIYLGQISTSTTTYSLSLVPMARVYQFMLQMFGRTSSSGTMSMSQKASYLQLSFLLVFAQMKSIPSSLHCTVTNFYCLAQNIVQLSIL